MSAEVETKKCTLCLIQKDLVDFPARGNRCLECRRIVIRYSNRTLRSDKLYKARELCRRKEYRKNNAEALNKVSREFYKNNRQKEIDRVLRYFKTESGKKNARNNTRKRREAKAFLDSIWTPEHETFVYDRYGKKCCKCGSTDRIELDHVYPLSKGYPLNKLNCLPLCKTCNSSKGSKSPIDFYGEFILDRFRLNEFEVKMATKDQLEWLFVNLHYSGTIPPFRYGYGLYLYEDLVGGCIFSRPSRQNISADLELSRFFVMDGTPKNTESYFLGSCLRLLRRDGFVGKIITFADVTEGHTGIIYRATNWREDGFTGPNYHYRSSSGDRMHKKQVWNRAVKNGVKESEQALAEGLTKIAELPKARFFYEVK